MKADKSFFNRKDNPGGRFITRIFNQYEQANACEALTMVRFAIEETVSTLYNHIWNEFKKTNMRPENCVFSHCIFQFLSTSSVHQTEQCFTRNKRSRSNAN